MVTGGRNYWLCLVVQVHAAYWLLRWFGREKLANRLYTGWKAWDHGNQAMYDMNLSYSIKNVRKLDNMLVEDEKDCIRLLFTPKKSDWHR